MWAGHLLATVLRFIYKARLHEKHISVRLLLHKRVLNADTVSTCCMHTPAHDMHSKHQIEYAVANISRCVHVFQDALRATLDVDFAGWQLPLHL